VFSRQNSLYWVSFRSAATLWEHLGHTSLVNRLLSELRGASQSAIGEIYSELKNESPQKLYHAIDRAHFECMKADHEAFEPLVLPPNGRGR
uniref:hypothetical protein n=1 Tax=Acinetobacter sp. TaxID=472 RepID=UPI0028A6722E